MDIIVGTAGHIDHGKTALVKALTGIDTDRLPEEKQRGITIDLGFAELDLGEVRIGFVDVPGHERFIKNMLAGASGIDLVLLVIAADEGVMPQTREHFEICRLLEIRKGLIVLTKKDLVDAELLELVRLETAELVEDSFLDDAPVMAVSAKTGEGLDELKRVLLETAKELPSRNHDVITLLNIDRRFTVKGFGAVVTGTLVSGVINETDELEILPSGKKVRVRGLQTHGKNVKVANAGQRVAVNLSGIDHSEIIRGMVLTERNILRPTQIFDAEVEVLHDAKKALKSRQRVRAHIGTIEALARVQVLNETGEIKKGEKDFAQFRLETPVAAIADEHFIIRSYSPQITIGGGKALDVLAEKHRRKDIDNVRKYLRDFVEADYDKAEQLRIFVQTSGKGGASFADLQARTAWRKEILQKAIVENLERNFIVEAEGLYLARTTFEKLKENTLAEIGSYHQREPLAKGILKETLREKVFGFLPAEIFRTIIGELEKAGKIVSERDILRLGSHNTELTDDEKAVHERLSHIYKAARFEVPKMEEAFADALTGTTLQKEDARKIFQLLLNSREIVKISEEFYFAKSAIDELVEKMKGYAGSVSNHTIDVPKFKELAGVSRKYAIPLLEYFDREKITRRTGDKRLIL